MQVGSSLHMEIGPVSDLITMSGSATLAGTLTVSLVGGFTPNVGQSFTLLTASTRSGAFGTETMPSLPNIDFDVIYNPQSVVVQVVPELPGDFNADGTVDAADYVVWRKTLVSVFPNGYNDWRAHFGESLGSGEGSSATPEPGSLLLVAVAGAAMLCGRGYRFVRNAGKVRSRRQR
jgi:hypothetical protein